MLVEIRGEYTTAPTWKNKTVGKKGKVLLIRIYCLMEP